MSLSICWENLSISQGHSCPRHLLTASSMVNNAGIAPEASNPRPVWETPMDVFDATWGVNVRGVFLGSKYAGAQMREQARLPELPKAGTIINMASVLGVLGKPGTAAYAAAKGAVISMTRAVAMDYAPHGIHCNSILPGCKLEPLFNPSDFDVKSLIQILTGSYADAYDILHDRQQRAGKICSRLPSDEAAWGAGGNRECCCLPG